MQHEVNLLFHRGSTNRDKKRQVRTLFDSSVNASALNCITRTSAQNELNLHLDQETNLEQINDQRAHEYLRASLWNKTLSL